MKTRHWIAIILLAIIIAAYSQTPETQIASQYSQLFLPLVQTDSGQDPEQPCRYVETTVMLYWIYEDRVDGPYQVIDCLQHDKHWEKPVERTGLVEVRGSYFQHWGIAYQGERWLNVLIWHKSIKSYSLNLLLLE